MESVIATLQDEIPELPNLDPDTENTLFLAIAGLKQVYMYSACTFYLFFMMGDIKMGERQQKHLLKECLIWFIEGGIWLLI